MLRPAAALPWPPRGPALGATICSTPRAPSSHGKSLASGLRAAGSQMGKLRLTRAGCGPRPTLLGRGPRAAHAAGSAWGGPLPVTLPLEPLLRRTSGWLRLRPGRPRTPRGSGKPTRGESAGNVRESLLTHLARPCVFYTGFPVRPCRRPPLAGWEPRLAKSGNFITGFPLDSSPKNG